MALIKCPECGKEISNMAKICPHCGINILEYHNTHQKTNWLKIIFSCCAVFIVFVAIMINIFTDWFKPEKVTPDEFDQIHKGMSYEQVCSIVGNEYNSFKKETNNGSSASEQLFYTYKGVGVQGCEVVICYIDNKVEWKKHTGLFGKGFTTDMELS